VVTDFLIAPLLAVLQWAVNALPDGQPVSIPGVGPLVTWISRVDSLIPISGPLTFAMGMLGLVVVFVGVRLLLTAWNLVWP
jgi:hypothetical protein